VIREDFAGAGGWSEALRQLGRTDVVGIEADPDACATAESAGHHRVQGDVRAYPPGGPLEGYVASPPCQPLSEAAGDARLLLRQLLTAADLVAAGHHQGLAGPSPVLDARGLLSLWPLHVVRVARPGWVALEQVRTVQPLWDRYAEHLRRWGYSCWTGRLRAELYGVPQTRQRSVLLASRLRLVTLPAATHSEPVSMRQALPALAASGLQLRSNYGNNGVPGARGMRSLDQPAPTITGKATRCWWVHPDGSKARNLTHLEAAALQGFGPSYTWHGPANHRDDIIGNAVPVPMAVACLRAVL